MEKALVAGHKGLKLSHALILPQIASDGSRIVDIARSQGVSKQAIGQIANELEDLGYLSRTDDPEDKRSKKLTLTAQGVTLVKQAAGFMGDIDDELRVTLGPDTFNQLLTLSSLLFKKLSLKFPEAGVYAPHIGNTVPLIAFCIPLATRLDLLLQQQNTAKGHTPLKRSYWQVLEKITHNGVRINDLAELNGISKQAISQLANEIEKAGYIARVEDPNDKRAKNLVPTHQGKKLILDTLQSTAHVEHIIETYIGNQALKDLKHCFDVYLKSKSPKQPAIATKQTLQACLQTFITSLDKQEREQWLDENHRLNNKAIEKICQMEFR